MAGHGMQQSQHLALQQILAPQLQQSLLILQTPLLELRNLVQQEMETNPVLEELPDEPSSDGPDGAEPSADNNFKEEFEKLASLDEEWRDYMAQSSSYSRDGSRGSPAEKENSLEYKVISEHMEDLGKRRFPEIARRMNISVEEVQKCANRIARLNPRPGQVFAAAPQNYVLPDVTVEKVDGDYQIILNNEQIPHLRISNIYKDIIAQDNNGADVKDYIRDKIRSGKFLIRSIHQRQQTISNIAHQIVSRQRDFFEHGPSHLKPMTMGEIADAVGVHETTVSRAVSGKYMETPQGIFDMKYFFTPGYQTATGESMSNTSVKEAILDLVKHENGNAPLSDQEIVEILGERGIPIARRTVAKYRTELDILPSHLRRKNW